MDKTLAIMITLIVLLGIGVSVFLVGRPSGSATDLPSYATSNSRIREAYEFAVSNPDALDGITCRCGCMQMPHDGRVHSRGLHDCFLRDGGFDSHAANCDMCINDALQAKSLYGQGKSKAEINSIIGAKYIK